MDEISIYVGLDVHAVTISACVVAAEKRSGEEIFSGTFAATPEALGRLIGRVAKLGRAQFCYEALALRLWRLPPNHCGGP